MKRLKISREGIVLIKSFEGFRPRAIPRQDGGWVIGYGHTLSAREGASVSEADAELLLQYDLLPVVQAVNDGVEGRVNQHQFDALASFVFSVGVDRFGASDVLERIRAGFSTEAADAMVGWPEPALPEAALRRRAAERALFVADPAAPVALADLLAAPLPPPPVPSEPVMGAPVADTGTEEAQAEAPQVIANTPSRDASSDAEVIEALPDARSVALAHLLDTPDGRLDGPEVADVEIDNAEPTPEPATDADLTPEPDAPSQVQPWIERQAEHDGAADDAVPAPDPTSSDAPGEDAVLAEPEPEPASEPVEPPVSPIVFPSLSAHRYSPYSSLPVGPLPPISSATEPAPQPAEPIALAEAEPQTATAPVESGDQDVAVAPHPDPATGMASTDVEGFVHPLVLTPLAEGGFTTTPRLVWPEDSREGDDTQQTPLFDEDAVLHRTLGPVVRPEMIDNAPGRFSWGEAGAYLVMGGFGLVSFGMGMAAFRLASQQSSGSNETALIGGVLTLIAVACVGVSTYNLYRRWGRSDAD